MATAEYLCVSCSLCCDGSLFGRVPLSRAEKDRLGGEEDLYFTKADGSVRMRLGCSRLGTDGGCQCYETRPAVCRSYKCRLLHAVEQDRTSETSAISVIREIKDLQATATARLAEAEGMPPHARTGMSGLDAQKTLRRLQMEGVPDKREPALAHAAACFAHLTALVRLHIKRSYLR